MGHDIQSKGFDEQDRIRFQTRIEEQLALLKTVIRAPDFGRSELKMGAELELYLIDNQGRCQLSNIAILEALKDKQFQPEINRYNIEFNSSAMPLQGTPFSSLFDELTLKLRKIQQIATQHDTQPLAIGILPTLQKSDLGPVNMTPKPRYQVLAEQLRAQRGEPFEVHIAGDEQVHMQSNDVTLEGANTSLQVHMMVPHQRFADVFNAARLTAPFTLALAANSPFLFGKKLWQETRIALFKQSLDCRLLQDVQWRQPARVTFGGGWIRKDAWELYAHAVSLYPPLLPVCSDRALEPGLPALDELNLHMGTIWPWHRPVYSHHDGGHVRIEFRALPAGPSIPDMVANSAFAIGLAMGMADEVDDYLALMPLRYAEFNFYRSAQFGLDAEILWPKRLHSVPKPVPISALLPDMLDIAANGLNQLGVEQEDIQTVLGNWQGRVAQGINGAIWQRNWFEHYCQSGHSREQALVKLVHQYQYHWQTGVPLIEWERPS